MNSRVALCASLLLCAACGNSLPSYVPTAATPPSPPANAPSPPRYAFVPTGLPSLGACHAAPNYFSDVELFRRERMPVRAWVSDDNDTRAYLAGIRKGLATWGAATGGVISVVETTDRVSADFTISVDPYPPYDCRQRGWYGIFIDSQRVLESRTIRGGGIHMCPDNFHATPDQVSRVAKLIAHELGHALGIGGHSGDVGDVMYENDVAVIAHDDLFPWISQRDINTMITAYCN